MPNFTLKPIEAIEAAQPFFQLVIDGTGQLDLFENTLHGTTYAGELRTMLTYMEYAANGGMLPGTKMKDITPSGEAIKEYEFKSKHLRLYSIRHTDGRILILCGFKNKQPGDIRRFRSLKKQWLTLHGK